MVISSKEIEMMFGREVAMRLCEWLSIYSPVECKEVFEAEKIVCFDIDDAIEFAKIKMHHDLFKREFFPHLVKLKHGKVSGAFATIRSAS